MNEATLDCPVCTGAARVLSSGNVDGVETDTLDCCRCGCYPVARPAMALIRSSDHQRRTQLSAWLRERHVYGVEVPALGGDFLAGLLGSLPVYTPREKQGRLLKAIERLTDYPGAAVTMTPDCDYPLAWAGNEQELQYYVKALLDRALLDFPYPGLQTQTESPYPVLITPAGWKQLEDDRTDLASNTQAFVAMSFDPGLRAVYEQAIAPAIARTGYRAHRMDVEPHLERIDVKIVAEIRASRFLVADVTQQKAGVYYEAGFAQGLGIPVIWSVRRDDVDNVHFDTRQYNHIVWDTPSDLGEKLSDFILATIGRPAGPRS